MLILKSKHRLLCGDSTNKADVDRLMNGAKADMVFTSPPYSDLRDYGGDLNLNPTALAKAIFNFPAKTYIVNLGLILRERAIVRYWDEYLEVADELNIKLLSWLVWDKGNASAPGHQQAIFGLCHEWIFVFGDYKEQKRLLPNKHSGVDFKGTVRLKDGSTQILKSPIKVSSHRQLDTVVRDINADKSRSTNHPAPFPVELAETFIESVDPELVCEPFCGSGTTLIACEKTNRKCYGMEIDPHYCSVIIKRYEDYSGKKAIHA